MDLRADLYGLGCTLYTLLAGRVPFPGAALVEKTTNHRVQATPCIRAIRPDVPMALSCLCIALMENIQAIDRLRPKKSLPD